LLYQETDYGLRHLTAEGVLYAEKDFNLAKHPEIDVPNLQVIKLMQSFKSKEYVTELFAWRHYYWCAAGRAPASYCLRALNSGAHTKRRSIVSVRELSAGDLAH
jgi:Plectin/S10 domain